jgi:hypothetical protein
MYKIMSVKTHDAMQTGRNGNIQCHELVLYYDADVGGVDIYGRNSKGSLTHGGFYDIPADAFEKLCKEFLGLRECPSADTKSNG